MSGEQESMEALVKRVVKASRERKPPSARNRQIADAVWVNGRTQVEVAAEFRLSQRRVSQICQQVEAWQAQTQAWQRGQTCGSEEKEVENELQKRQLTEIYRRSMRAFTRSERPLVSRRSRKCGEDEQWSEEHEREQRLDTGSLRVALRALEQRSKLAPRHDPERRYTSDQHVQNLEWIAHILSQYRRDAEQRGEVPRGQESSSELVERLMRELLAGSTESPLAGTKPGPGEVPQDAPSQGTGSRFASGCGGEVPQDAPSQVTGSRFASGYGGEVPQDAPSQVTGSTFASGSCAVGAERLGNFGQTNLRQEMDNFDLPLQHRLACATVLIKQQDTLLDRDDNEIELRQQVDDSEAVIEARLMAAQMLLKRQAARLTAAARSSSPRDVEAQVEEQVAGSGVALSDAAAASCDEATFEAVAEAGAENFEPRSAPDRADAAEARALERAERQRKARARIEYQFGVVMSDESIAAELAHLRQWEKGCYSMTEHSREQREALIEWRRLKRGRDPPARIQPSG